MIMEVKDLLVSWYFEPSNEPLRTFGATKWLIANSKADTIEQAQIELVDVVTERLTSAEAIKLFTAMRETTLVLLDDHLGMQSFSKVAKQVGISFDIKLVKRTGSIEEQVLKYKSMLKKDCFYVPESRFTEPDLIFDEIPASNLIDDIMSDEQTVFPMTESLMIACHYFDSIWSK